MLLSRRFSRRQWARVGGVSWLLVMLVWVIGYGQIRLPIALPQAATLSVSCTEVIRVSPEGHASIVRTLTVPPSLLTEPYRTYAEALQAQVEAREDFANELQRQYRVLLNASFHDIRTVIRRPEVGLMATVPIVIEATAEVPGLAKLRDGEGIWLLPVGPQDHETQELAFDAIFNGMVFRSLLLASFDGEQRFEAHRETRFELPKGARILNGAALAELRWSLEFGGGTSITARLEVGEHLVTLRENLVQTENPPEPRAAEVASASIAGYGVFTIEYSTPSLLPLPIQPIPSSSYVSPHNWSKDWSYSTGTNVSCPLPDPYGSGSSVQLQANPSLYFGTHLGWQFKKGNLKRFDAWIQVNPKLSATAIVNLTKSVTWTVSKDLWDYSQTYVFFVDFVPVWITLSLEITGTASVTASATSKFTCSSYLSNINKLGATWTGSWSAIAENTSPSVTSPTFSLTTGATVGATAGPELCLAAYIYSVAGPFVSLTPYLKAELSASSGGHGSWTFKGGFTASGGVKLAGWLEDYLGLGSYSTDFYSWEKTLKTGTW